MSEPPAPAARSLLDLPPEVLERVWVALDEAPPFGEGPPLQDGTYTADRHSLLCTCTAARRLFSPLIHHVQLGLPSMPEPSDPDFARDMAAWAAAPAAQQRFLQGIGTLRRLDIWPDELHRKSDYMHDDIQLLCLEALHPFLALARPQLQGVTTLRVSNLRALDSKDLCHLLWALPNVETLIVYACLLDSWALASLAVSSKLRSLNVSRVHWSEDDLCVSFDEITDALGALAAIPTLTHLTLDVSHDGWELEQVLPTLGSLLHLQQLYLTHSRSDYDVDALDLSVFSHLQPLRQLTDLRFATAEDVGAVSTPLDQVQGLADLTQLRHLSLLGPNLEAEALEALMAMPRLHSLHLWLPHGEDWRDADGALPCAADGSIHADSATGGGAGGGVRELRCFALEYNWLKAGFLMGLTRLTFENKRLTWGFSDVTSVPGFERAARSLVHCMRLSGDAAVNLVVECAARASVHHPSAVAGLRLLDTRLRSLTLRDVEVNGRLVMQLACSLPHLSDLTLSRYTVADARAVPELLQLQHLTSLSLLLRGRRNPLQACPVEDSRCQQLLSHVSALCAAAQRPLQLHVDVLTMQQLEECRAKAAPGRHTQHVNFVSEALAEPLGGDMLGAEEQGAESGSEPWSEPGSELGSESVSDA